MKVTIYARAAGSRLVHVVPPAYRVPVAEHARPDGVYSLMLFAHSPRDVVPSAPVRKALRRLTSPAADGIIAVGTVFTAEARDLLERAGAHTIAHRVAKWTDDSARAR